MLGKKYQTKDSKSEFISAMTLSGCQNRSGRKEIQFGFKLLITFAHMSFLLLFACAHTHRELKSSKGAIWSKKLGVIQSILI